MGSYKATEATDWRASVQESSNEAEVQVDYNFG